MTRYADLRSSDLRQACHNSFILYHSEGQISKSHQPCPATVNGSVGYCMFLRKAWPSPGIDIQYVSTAVSLLIAYEDHNPGSRQQGQCSKVCRSTPAHVLPITGSSPMGFLLQQKTSFFTGMYILVANKGSLNEENRLLEPADFRGCRSYTRVVTLVNN